MGKRLILQAGYHRSGSARIRQWLEDHAEILSPHLVLYGPDHPAVAALCAAARAMALAHAEAPAALTRAAGDLLAEIAAQEAPLAILCAPDLLGPPLGHVDHEAIETEIYPGLCPILHLLSEEFASLDPVLALFERAPDSWLAALHARALRQEMFLGDLQDFLDHYTPWLDWGALRDEITLALQGRMALAHWPFEDSVRRGAVSGMGFFDLLEIPESLMARCAPSLPPDPEPDTAGPMSATPSAPASGAVPVLLMGGANALAPGGWGHLMRRDYGALVAAQNLSTAAGSTVMMLYRLLAQGGRWPGAPVIWEQGINDYSQMVGGQTPASLLYHLEWLLQLCARENRPLVPLLTRSRAQAGLDHEDAYVTGLRALFDSYGLTPIDTGRLITVLDRGPAAPEPWYERNAVYEPGTDLPRRMTEAALLALEQARPPRPPAARAGHFDPLELRLCRPDPAPEHVVLTGLPTDFAPFDSAPALTVPGRVLAAMIVTGGNSPVIRMRGGETEFGPFVTQVPHVQNQPQQLRQLVLGQQAGGVEIPGGLVQIDTNPSRATPIVQTMFHPGAPSSDPLPTGLAALLCEAPREPAA